MKHIRKSPAHLVLALTLAAASLLGFQLNEKEAVAQSSYFTSQGCIDCHAAPAVATCNGCHAHGTHASSAKSGINVTGTTSKTSYAPGETVSVTIAGGYRTGWLRAVLYNQNTVELARSNGNASDMGSSTTYPATLSAPAPTAPGSYTWKVAWYGNEYDVGTYGANWTPDPNNPNHGYEIVNTNTFTVAAAGDTTVPVVGSFTLPATATGLTVPVSALSATDNVAVTGYLIGTSATAPAASAAGWSATAPASVTAVAGSNTFYAWAKDAAGNVSLSKSAVVTVTLPDATAPVVGAFTLPASSTNLTILISALSATDNVAVTGYLITSNSAAPAASALGWTASAPASVTASAAGNNTFYAWAKDAAGNVSLSKSAVVTVTLPDATAPVVGAFTLPATATSLTVPVSALSATDNVAVTGYLIGTSATAPAASAAGWSATAPASVTAVAGNNTFYAWAKDAAGNVSAGRSASVTVTIATDIDTTKPTLTVSALSSGSYTNKTTLNISGNASDAGGLQSVSVNDQPVVVNADGSFSAALPLVVGANTVTVVATDKAGNQQIDTRTITFDPTAPVLAVSAPSDNSTSAQSFLTLTGTVNESSTVSVAVNGGSQQSATISGSNFSATVNLTAGVNTIVVTATDLAGNTVSAKRTVTYTAGTMALAITYPLQDITTTRPSIVLTGKIADALGQVSVRIVMNGRSYTPPVVNGAFRQQLNFYKFGSYAITITAKDASGNSSTVTRNVIYRAGERDDHHDDD